MALNKLNDEEKNILLQLSYFDIPDNVRANNLSPEELWIKIKRNSNNSDDVRTEKLDAFFNSPAYEKSNLADVKLKGYQNNNPHMDGKSESGFVGYAWGDTDGNASAVFRGSEDFKNIDHLKTDWKSNVEAGLGVTIEQQKEANRFYEQYVKGADGSKELLGHSKGGNIVSYVYVENLEDNPRGYVVNGAPIFWPSLTDEQKKALKSDRFDFIAYEGDFVHDLGYAPYLDKVVALNKDDYSDPFYPHYETSVDFKNGTFVKSRPGGPDTMGEAAAESFKFITVYTVHGFREAYKAIVAVGNAAAAAVVATWKGMETAARKVVDSCVAFISGLKHVTTEVIKGAREFLSAVVSKAKSTLARIFGALAGGGGGGFAVEPYIKVNVDRLAYYVWRLQAIKRKTAALNSKIDSLYTEVGVFGLDNVLKADMLTSFDWRINQNISYLQTAASLLERTETELAGKARAIR
ncbi:Mbeg1-like protein [Neobacillus kokaensis]|uniref:DUF2974 domain-containing protein n=1 Tax=Neobacillus kokaensis TaxID=2759023 RepID=A0ABQ3N5F0_9BACI|nr:Mbeg1-like protein [Neobacillus kokaensis]GHH98742.1 hypothetical protein AM1BK_22850 [Neobacillus kokaensis]